MGVSLSLRLKDETISKVFSTENPDLIPLRLDFWIVGPSAIGSEKGNPTSIISAPAFGNAKSNFFDVEKFGSYADINDTKSFFIIIF